MHCSACSQELPSQQFKFCPFCGAATDPPKPMTTEPYVREITPDEPPAAPDPAEAPTLFELPAVSLEDATAGMPGPMSEDAMPAVHDVDLPAAAQSREEVPEDDKPTVLNMPAISEELLEDVLSKHDEPEEPKVSAPAPSPPAPETSSRSDGSAKFSETAWFMAAVTPEQLAESEGEALDYAQQDRMTERYETDERLPDEVRRGFSLTATELPSYGDDGGPKAQPAAPTGATKGKKAKKKKKPKK